MKYVAKKDSKKSLTSNYSGNRIIIRVISSVGRASPLQGEGRQFEPVITHQVRYCDLRLT